MVKVKSFKELSNLQILSFLNLDNKNLFLKEKNNDINKYIPLKDLNLTSKYFFKVLNKYIKEERLFYEE